MKIPLAPIPVTSLHDYDDDDTDDDGDDNDDVDDDLYYGYIDCADDTDDGDYEDSLGPDPSHESGSESQSSLQCFKVVTFS